MGDVYSKIIQKHKNGFSCMSFVYVVLVHRSEKEEYTVLC